MIYTITIKSKNRVRGFFVGTQGPRGADGTATVFVHTQSSPATEWIVNHNLGAKPFAEILDTGGNVVEVEVIHISTNQLRVYFSSAQAGQVRCI